MHSLNAMQSGKLYKFHVSVYVGSLFPLSKLISCLLIKSVQRADKPQQHKKRHTGRRVKGPEVY